MTQTYWPMPKGSAGSQVLEPNWSLMSRNWLANGVLKGFLNELAVTADGTAMQVNIDTGAANIMGDWFKNDASVVMPIAAADATNPRIDVIAIRVDWVANTVAFVALEGVPAANPVAPALTQTDLLITPATARWEIALANVEVPAAATTITAADVTDKRAFAGAPTSTATPGATVQYDASGGINTDYINGLVANDTWHDLTLENGWANYGNGYYNAQYKKDADGFVHLRGMISGGTTTGGTLLCTLPAGYRPSANIDWSTVSNLAFAQISMDNGGNLHINLGSNAWLSLHVAPFQAEQ